MTPLLNLILILTGGCNMTCPIPTPLGLTNVTFPSSLFNGNSSTISTANCDCKCHGIPIVPNICEMFQKLGLCCGSQGTTTDQTTALNSTTLDPTIVSPGEEDTTTKSSSKKQDAEPASNISDSEDDSSAKTTTDVTTSDEDDKAMSTSDKTKTETSTTPATTVTEPSSTTMEEKVESSFEQDGVLVIIPKPDNKSSRTTSSGVTTKSTRKPFYDEPGVDYQEDDSGENDSTNTTETETTVKEDTESSTTSNDGVTTPSLQDENTLSTDLTTSIEEASIVSPEDGSKKTTVETDGVESSPVTDDNESTTESTKSSDKSTEKGHGSDSSSENNEDDGKTTPMDSESEATAAPLTGPTKSSDTSTTTKKVNDVDKVSTTEVTKPNDRPTSTEKVPSSESSSKVNEDDEKTIPYSADKKIDETSTTKSSNINSTNENKETATTPGDSDSETTVAPTTESSKSSDKPASTEKEDDEKTTLGSSSKNTDKTTTTEVTKSSSTETKEDIKNTAVTPVNETTSIGKPSEAENAEPGEDYGEKDDDSDYDSTTTLKSTDDYIYNNDYDDEAGVIMIIPENAVTTKSPESSDENLDDKTQEETPDTKDTATAESVSSEETPEPKSDKGAPDTPHSQKKEIKTDEPEVTTESPSTTELEKTDNEDNKASSSSATTQKPEPDTKTSEPKLTRKPNESKNKEDNEDIPDKTTTDSPTTPKSIQTTESSTTTKSSNETSEDSFTEEPHSTSSKSSDSTSPDDQKNKSDPDNSSDWPNDDKNSKDLAMIDSSSKANELEPESSTKNPKPDSSNCLEVDKETADKFENITLQPLEKKTLKKFINSINEFGLDLTMSILRGNTTNYAVTPINFALLLLMAENGACGDTKKELDDALHLSKEISTEYLRPIRNLVDSLKSINKTKLFVGNKIFLSENVEVNPAYSDLMKVVHQSDPLTVDYKKLNDVTEQINRWGANKTNNFVQSIISGSKNEVISEDTSVLLAGVGYFQTNWVKSFNRLFNDYKLFYIGENTYKSVCTMLQINQFYYYHMDYLPAEVIELPLTTDKDRELKMIVILPDEGKTLPDVVENLNKFQYSDFRKYARLEIVELSLPKFKIETFIDLHDYSDKVKINKTLDNSDLCCVSESVKITRVLQKTILKVNEGECAGPYYLCEGDDNSCMSQKIKFTVNRPFIFLIIKDDTIVFSGQITDPSHK